MGSSHICARCKGFWLCKDALHLGRGFCHVCRMLCFTTVQHRDVQLNAKVQNTCIVHVPDASVQHTSVLDSNIINISTSPTHHSQLALNDCMPQIIEVTTCVAAAVVLQRLCCQHCDTRTVYLPLAIWPMPAMLPWVMELLTLPAMACMACTTGRHPSLHCPLQEQLNCTSHGGQCSGWIVIRPGLPSGDSAECHDGTMVKSLAMCKD